MSCSLHKILYIAIGRSLVGVTSQAVDKTGHSLFRVWSRNADAMLLTIRTLVPTAAILRSFWFYNEHQRHFTTTTFKQMVENEDESP